MKQEKNRSPRAALLMSAAALLATPAIAQEVAPPPIAPTTTASPVAPPPVAATVAPATPAPERSGASATPVNPDAAAQAAAEDGERRNARPAARERARTAVPATRAAAATAPVAAEPVTPATAPAPVAQQPAPAAEATVTEQPSAATTTDEAATTTTSEQGPPLWPLALIAALIVAAGIAFFVMRRRRVEPEYEAYAPVYKEPVRQEPAHVAPIVTPVAAAAPAGVMIEDRIAVHDEPSLSDELDGIAAAPDRVRIAEPAPADVAAVTAAETQGNRPWLEFAMRPVSAGTTDDNALVQIELTVGNAGNMDAEDVRISTFMLPAGNDSDMDRLLTEPRDEAVAPMTIPAGTGTRVDATMTLSREELVNGAGNAAFQPVIIADARYRLPDGSEGRTSASFLIGGTPANGDALEPIALDGTLLRDDVEARLYREPARV